MPVYFKSNSDSVVTHVKYAGRDIGNPEKHGLIKINQALECGNILGRYWNGDPENPVFSEKPKKKAR